MKSKEKIFSLAVVIALLLGSIWTPAFAAPKAIALPALPSGCNYGSLVLNSSTSAGVRVWNHILRFDWCWNGTSVYTVGGKLQYVQVLNTWLNAFFRFEPSIGNIVVSGSTDGAKIITATASVKQCVIQTGWCYSPVTSIIRIRLMKDGTARRE